MGNIRHPEWRESLEDTNYPFEDAAPLTNTNGAIIDREVFLDASLYPVGGTGRYYLSKVVNTNTLVTIYIGDNENRERAQASFHVNNVPDSLRLADTHGRPAGILVSEALRLIALKSMGTGTHEFSITQTPFVASVCVPMPEIGIQGILLDSGDLLTGDIWLVGDDGVVITTGTTTNRGCFTAPETPETPPPVSEETAKGADILFLIDTTGSMGSIIATVQTMMPAIFDAVRATVPTLDNPIYWGVADYRDFEDGGDYFSKGYKLRQAFTADESAILNALSGLLAAGGGDMPEQNLAALRNVTLDWLANGGRTTVPRAIIWAGDVHGWEGGAKGQAYPTLQSAIDTLVDDEILIFALNSLGEGAGIDAIGPVPTAGRQQASTIIEDTGGMLYQDLLTVDPSVVADAIVESIVTTVTSAPSTPTPPPSQVLCDNCCVPPRSFNTIRIDIVGDPLFRRKLCAEPALFQTPQFIQNICFTTPETRGITSSPGQIVAAGADILFLIDTTGSMGGLIGTIRTMMPAIFAAVSATVPALENPIYWGVADYRDFEDGGDYATKAYRLRQAFTVDESAILSALSGLSVSGGGDIPEQNLAALTNTTRDWVINSGRTTVPRAIIWAGDARSWENSAKGYPHPTLQSTINTLVDNDILIFALNSLALGSGIDDIGPAPSDGRRQASTITAATGGELYPDLLTVAASIVADAIVESILTTVAGTPGEPGVPPQVLCCGPGERGNIGITVGSQDALDTILRIRPAAEGLIIEAVGEKLEDIR